VLTCNKRRVFPVAEIRDQNLHSAA
jgi:hypothetical protein